MSAPLCCTIASGSLSLLNPNRTTILSAGRPLLTSVQVWPPSVDLAAAPVAPAQIVLVARSTARPTIPSAPGGFGPKGWATISLKVGSPCPQPTARPAPPPPPPPLPPPEGRRE